MADSSPPPNLERHLVSRLAEIAKRITELSQEQKVLQRMLERVRREMIPNVDVARKNSHQRILVETSIIQSLSRGHEMRSVKSLFMDAQLMVPDLNASTFRSYLRRLSQRGLIRQIGARGGWTLEAPPPSDPVP